MSEHPIKNVMDSALSGLKSVADVNTIIGKPIEAADGTVIIPVSKLSLGFGVGGSDFKGVSADSDGRNLFGGGSGGGLKIEPVAFLIAGVGDVKLLSIDTSTSLTDAIPEVVDFVASLVKKKKKKDTNSTEADND